MQRDEIAGFDRASRRLPDGCRSLPRLLSVREVAEIFRRSTRTIRIWVRAGHLKPVRMGRSVFFREADVFALLGLNGPDGSAADVAAGGPGNAANSAG
jgi:excisionase family DNA binding protein